MAPRPVMETEMTYQPFQSEGRSKRRGIVRVDRRTREGKLLEQTRAALTLHVGGEPNFFQRATIERAAFLTVGKSPTAARSETLATRSRIRSNPGGALNCPNNPARHRHRRSPSGIS